MTDLEAGYPLYDPPASTKGTVVTSANPAISTWVPEYVYVASSWRNPMQPGICAALKAAGIEHYDFRNPEPGNDGFRWTDVDPDWSRECKCDHTRGRHGFCAAHGESPHAIGGTGCACPKGDGTTSPESYLRSIEHPVAIRGFELDFEAMERADTFVLVLPCGRSAHLELGWAVGAGKQTAILLDDPVTPELMYRMVDFVAPSLFDLLGWLGVED